MAKPRKQISTRTRFEIFKRDGFECQYCGRTPPAVILEVDHICPVCEGGTNDPDNLVTSCQDCNRGKAGVPLSSVPQSLSDKAAEVAEREKQLAGYREIMDKRRERLEAETWEVADIFIAHARKDGIRKDYFASIKRFVEKLGVHECLEAMEIATSRSFFNDNKTFKYFCGICWRKIKEAGNG